MRVKSRSVARATAGPAVVMDRATVRRMEKSATRACGVLAAMSNPSRLLILCQLAEGEKSVGELEPLIGLSQSALSQHLAVLRGKHLVRTRRNGQSILYSLASKEATALMQTVHDEFCKR